MPWQNNVFFKAEFLVERMSCSQFVHDIIVWKQTMHNYSCRNRENPSGKSIDANLSVQSKNLSMLLHKLGLKRIMFLLLY